jgi:hypothetical protein
MSSESNVRTAFVTVHVVGDSAYRIDNARKIWNRTGPVPEAL